VVSRIRESLTQNWALKLAALSLAVLLWLAVRAEAPRTATFRNIPVQVDLRDPGWQLAGEPEPSGIHVTVRGSASELMTLAGEPPRIILPVERVADTVETQVVPIQWVRLPAGAARAIVIGLRPDTIRLHYERLETRALPVRVRLTGELPDGSRLGRPVATSPVWVEVRGPVRLVSQLDSVPLMPVDVSGLRSTTNVPARVDTAVLERLRVTPSEVNVALRVRPQEMEPAESVQETAARRRGIRF
jgi:YbbR domain-containing protein